MSYRLCPIIGLNNRARAPYLLVNCFSQFSSEHSLIWPWKFNTKHSSHVPSSLSNACPSTIVFWSLGSMLGRTSIYNGSCKSGTDSLPATLVYALFASRSWAWPQYYISLPLYHLNLSHSPSPCPTASQVRGQAAVVLIIRTSLQMPRISWSS